MTQDSNEPSVGDFLVLPNQHDGYIRTVMFEENIANCTMLREQEGIPKVESSNVRPITRNREETGFRSRGDTTLMWEMGSGDGR